MGGLICWSQNAILGTAMNYTRMVTFLSDHLKLTQMVMACMAPAEVDSFVLCIVNVFARTGAILPLINRLLRDEFAVNAQAKGTLMRSNSIVSKITGGYVRQYGRDYLRMLLSDLITEIVSNENLDLEIQPSAFLQDPINRPSTDEELQRILAANQQFLQQTAQIFIDRITDNAMLDLMPREIRAIAAFTDLHANTYAPEQRGALVGGFMMLRFISPAVVAPEAYGILSSDVVPCKKARRNLVLLAKLLQNCSNGVLYGSKESYMTCMNSFVEQNVPRLTQFFKDAITDARVVAGESSRPWEEFEHTKKQAVGIDILNFDLDNLFQLHTILDHCREPLEARLEKTTSIPTALKEEVKDLLEALGPGPCVPKAGRSKLSGASRFRASQDFMGTSVKDSGDSTQSTISTEIALLEKAGFFYLGAPAKNGLPVIYAIANRFKREHLDNVDVLVTHIFNVLSLIENSRYYLVVDMSWARISTEMKREVYRQLGKLSSIFERRLRKNLEKVYVVHPSAYTRAVVLFMRQFTSSKLKKKIVELYNWEDLLQEIARENIGLPESSRDFITKAYHVIKVNAKGKSQKRIIKFTSNSLLNIDPKTKRIQNEKKLNEIAGLQAITDPAHLELFLTFVEAKAGASQTRRYIFTNAQDRDEVLLDIFRTGFSSAGGHLSQEFRVVKINKRGRHQDRTFKLTCDSLLNLDSSSIKSEISFAGIDSVTQDEAQPQVLYLQFKAESQVRKIICKDDATRLLKCLRYGIQRYRREDEEAFAREIYEPESDDV